MILDVAINEVCDPGCGHHMKYVILDVAINLYYAILDVAINEACDPGCCHQYEVCDQEVATNMKYVILDVAIYMKLVILDIVINMKYVILDVAINMKHVILDVAINMRVHINAHVLIYNVPTYRQCYYLYLLYFVIHLFDVNFPIHISWNWSSFMCVCVCSVFLVSILAGWLVLVLHTI